MPYKDRDMHFRVITSLLNLPSLPIIGFLHDFINVVGDNVSFWKDSPWSYGEIAVLWELAKKDVAPREIGRRVGKTEAAVREKAKELGIPLKDKEGA
jgi:hypothetical protein